MEYKKSYKGLIIWLVVFTVVLFLLPLIKTENDNLMTLLLLNLMSAGIAVLTWMIWKTESIYWYTGLTFEEAEKTPSEVRKRYALRHAKRFTIFAVIFAVYSVAAYIWSFPIGLSITLSCLGLVGVALSTMKIKLE